jgi:starch phosphorylase
MKFMMNGAVTIGTLDGANIEIREAVGADNFFLFGLTVDEIEALRPGYDPNAIIAADPEFARVMHRIENEHLGCTDPIIHTAIVQAIRNPHDPWMIAADFRSYIDAHNRAASAYMDLDGWTRMSILNTSASGRFSTDRTMREYNDDIWRLTPIAS